MRTSRPTMTDGGGRARGGWLAAALLATALVTPLAAGQQRDGRPGADEHHPPRPDADTAAPHEHRAHMEHRFEDAAAYAEAFDDPARDAWQMPARVIAELAIRNGDRVADIGAGTGYFTVRLAASTGAAAVYAVDVEPSMVEHIRARATGDGLAQVVPVLAAPETPDLPAPVDVVLIVNTYHHIPNRVAYFDALRASLRPGARLAIVDYRPGAPGGGPPDEFRFTAEEIAAELDEAGYTLQATHTFLPRQHFLVLVPSR